MKIIQNIINKKNNNSFAQFIRYMASSGFALSVDYSSLFICTEFLYIDKSIGFIISALLGMAVNYILNVSWVFKERRIENRLVEIVIFVAISLATIGLTAVLFKILNDFFSLYYMISKTITVIIGYLLRFILRKVFLFK